MPFLAWILVLLIPGLAAVFASQLTNSVASGLGAFIVLVILAGVGFYIFGPRMVAKVYPPKTENEPEHEDVRAS